MRSTMSVRLVSAALMVSSACCAIEWARLDVTRSMSASRCTRAFQLRQPSIPTKDKHTTMTNVVAQKVMDKRFGIVIPKAAQDSIYTALSYRYASFCAPGSAARGQHRLHALPDHAGVHLAHAVLVAQRADALAARRAIEAQRDRGGEIGKRRRVIRVGRPVQRHHRAVQRRGDVQQAGIVADHGGGARDQRDGLDRK